MACEGESVRSKFSPAMGMDFGWKIQSMVEKSKPLSSNVTIVILTDISYLT
jgi:hypothetical protein